MPRLLFLTVLAAGAAGFDLPAQTHGDLTARLTVHVADAGPQPGAALVRLTVTVTGGPLLEVEPPRLEDAVHAWEPERNDWSRLNGDRLTWTASILLRQVKPGPAPLPDVKVCFRDGPSAAWENAEWVDVLKTARDAPPPDLSPPAPSSAPQWFTWVGLAVVLGFAAAGWALGRRRTRPTKAPPERRALQELVRLRRAETPIPDVAAYHTLLSDIVRGYLAERLGLPALRRTTAEFLEAVRPSDRLSAEQQALLRDFLGRCDVVKFAPTAASPEECRETAALGQALVERTAAAPSVPVSR